MKYFDIGQRIRRYRKACGLSQEALAQKVGISVTHMSHIETGNTKLSLPVFLALAEALGVGTDELLRDLPAGRADALEELAGVLDGCDARQARIITDIARADKAALDKYGPGPE